MVWLTVVMSGVIGFCLGLMARRPRTRRLPSPIEELIDDQVALLPTRSIFTKKDEYHSARVMELEGEIKLISWDYSPDMAHLFHNDVEVKLTERQRGRLGRILKERITAGALDSVSTKLLEQ